MDHDAPPPVDDADDPGHGSGQGQGLVEDYAADPYQPAPQLRTAPDTRGVLDVNAVRSDPRAVSAVDVAAEVRVLAALFADASLIDEVSEKLDAADFGVIAHEAVFAAMLACDGSARAVDPVTVADELTRSGAANTVGGFAGVQRIADAGEADPRLIAGAVATAVADFSTYADIVADRATRRRLMAAARKIIEDAGSGKLESVGLVDSAEEAVFAVSASRSTSSVLTMPQVVVSVHEQMARASSSQLTGYSWGFNRLDQVTGGLQDGQLVIVAGRPGTGKSSLAAQVGRHIAEVNDVTVPILSYEMQASEIGLRLLSSATGVDLSMLMRGHVPHEMEAVVAREAEKMAELRLLVDDSPPATITGVRSLLRRLSRRTELGAVVIDYLQLLNGSNRRDGNREGEVAEISRSLKMLARELKIPVIACSQLNRGLEQRPNKRPLLSDLRESGSLEQDANVVVMTYREHLYNPAFPETEAELIVAKNRNGMAPATAYVDWEGKCTRFRDSNRTAPTGGDAPPGRGFGGQDAGGFGGGGFGGGGFGGAPAGGQGGFGAQPAGGYQGADPFGF